MVVKSSLVAQVVQYIELLEQSLRLSNWFDFRKVGLTIRWIVNCAKGIDWLWGAPIFSTTHNERVPAISPGCVASSACLFS